MNPAAIGIGVLGIILLFVKFAHGSSEPDSGSEALKPDVVNEPDHEALPIPDKVPGVDPETQKDIDAELERERAKLPTKFPSPFSNVPGEAWTKYVNGQRSGKLNTQSPGNYLGIWLMGARMLQDLGYMRNVKLVKRAETGKQVWDGEWISPYSLQRFLSDAALQYEAFRRMSERDANYIRAKHAATLAAKQKLPVITLSGLMAVAKQAGLKGMDEWIANPSTRKASTTAQFEKFNGLF